MSAAGSPALSACTSARKGQLETRRTPALAAWDPAHDGPRFASAGPLPQASAEYAGAPCRRGAAFEPVGSGPTVRPTGRVRARALAGTVASVWVTRSLARTTKRMHKWLCALAIAMAALPAWAASSAARLTVRVDAQDLDARVWVDGRELGSTPVSLEVDPGAHVVDLQWSGGRSSTDVALSSGDHQILVLSTTKVAELGTLVVEVPGVHVRVDGTARGETPLELALPAGDHVVTLRWPDGRVASRTVTVKPGDRVRLQRS